MIAKYDSDARDPKILPIGCQRAAALKGRNNYGQELHRYFRVLLWRAFHCIFGMWLKDSGSGKKDKSSEATRQDIVAMVGAQTVGNALLAAILAALLVH